MPGGGAEQARVFDTADPGLLADPYPYYASLRAFTGPVRSTDGAWVLASFAAVAAAMADAAAYSCADTNGLTRRTVPVLVGTDPPEHTRLRRAAARFFTGTARRDWQPRVDERVWEIVTGALRSPRIEAIGRVCAAVPVAILAELMDLDRARLARVLDYVSRTPGGDRRQVLAEFFGAEVQARRHAGGADLISSLIADGAGECALSADEVVGHCVLLLAAGIDAPRDLLANILIFLAEHPGAIAGMQADREAAVAFVEEALRYFSPVQAVYRTARVAQDGIRPGDRVLLLLGSANRDEAVWARADAFDAARNLRPNRAPAHLGLGSGVHRCLGAALARTAAVAAVQALAELDVRFGLEGAPVRGRNACFRRVVRLDLVTTAGNREARAQPLGAAALSTRSSADSSDAAPTEPGCQRNAPDSSSTSG